MVVSRGLGANKMRGVTSCLGEFKLEVLLVGGSRGVEWLWGETTRGVG